MKKRIIFLVGLGAGFVLGSRAGRQQYEKLKDQVLSVWNDPTVQTGVSRAADSVRENAPIVAEKVKEATPVVVEKVKEAVPVVADKVKEAVPAAGKAADAAASKVTEAVETAGDKANEGIDAAAAQADSAAKQAGDTARGKGGRSKTTAAPATSEDTTAPDGVSEDVVVPKGPGPASEKLAPAVLPDVVSDPEQPLDNESPDSSFIDAQNSSK